MGYLDQLRLEIDQHFQEKYLEKFVTLLFNRMVDIEVKIIHKLPKTEWDVADEYQKALISYVSSKLMAHRLKKMIEDDYYISEWDFGSIHEYPSHYTVYKNQTKDLKNKIRLLKKQQYIK